MRDSDVEVRFVLEDDLPSLVRDGTGERCFERMIERGASVKDAIERLGIPHTEVLAIAVNGVFVGFDRGVQAGDAVEVFSQSSARAPDPVRLGPSFAGWVPRFVLDVHLGTLARRLRLLGFDSVYQRDLDDPELARIASTEDRALLTRDRGLLKRNEVRRGHLVRSTVPASQLLEVIGRFSLVPRFAPFVRCIRCNGMIEPTSRGAVADRLAPGVLEDFEEFFACSRCGQPYWRGSHYDKLVALVDGLRGAAT
ncbi:MAG: MoaD/ThiS family protein [Polyangiaceae bacterium]|nr:MoaD/ThiS family protein [Polyangiaceae bacterium]